MGELIPAQVSHLPIYQSPVCFTALLIAIVINTGTLVQLTVTALKTEEEIQQRQHVRAPKSAANQCSRLAVDSVLIFNRTRA